MYEMCVPASVRMLNSISAIIDKAEAHCAAKKIDPLVMVNFRLAADMFPFAKQIHIMTDQIKGLMARLVGAEPPVYPDTDMTFDQLKARLAKTRDYLLSFKPEQLDGSESRVVVLKAGDNEYKYTGLQFATTRSLPNFYFHATTAYNILRNLGVEIGKMDYLGGR
jgi:hypothetical protein